MPVVLRRYPNLAVGLFYAVLASLLFFPGSSPTLLADDFQVVYRVATTRQLIPEGFFRPLSDFTFLLNYWIGGSNPAVFIGFNVLLHVAVSYGLYRFTHRTASYWGITHQLFPAATGLLFLVYPYHTETLSWAVGRGASLAVWFGLMALNIAISSRPAVFRMVMAAALYFIGMAAYETLLFFPLVLLVLLHALDKDSLLRKQWVGVMALSLGLHIAARYFYSGTLLGDYGGRTLAQAPGEYFGHMIRILARLLVPPLESAKTFAMTTAVTGGAMLLATGRYLQLTGWPKRWASPLFTLLLLLGLTLLVPATFSVSTHTSESDRLLYFPSVWCCLLLSMVLFTILGPPVMLMITGTFLFILSIGLLMSGLRHWQKAAALVTAVLDATRNDQASGRNTVWLNLPGEYQGAYVFRHGFEEALLMHQLDTAKVKYVNIVNEKDYRGRIFQPYREDGRWWLPPDHWVALQNNCWVVGNNADTVGRVLYPLPATLRYWDSKDLQELSLR